MAIQVPELNLLSIATQRGDAEISRTLCIINYKRAKQLSTNQAAKFVDCFFTTKGWAVSSDLKYYWKNA
jgi:hypothetical protein